MKAPTASLVSLSLLGFLAACSDLAAPVDPMSVAGSHSGGQSSSNAGNAGKGSSSGGGDHAGTGSGGTSSHAGNTGKSGSANSNGGKGGSGGDAGSTEDSTLSLTSADAHVVGRNGDAVRFTVKGTRPASGVYSIAVTFEDDTGTPVEQFDGDFDGTLDSSDGRIVFDAPVTADSFTATATLTGIKDVSKLIKAKVQLVDGSDQLSEPTEVTIGTQKKLILGDACDTKLVNDRCDAGQSCSGTPSKCAAGVAPTLVEVKYLHATTAGTGPTILVRGTDPDDDMGSFHVELLDSTNKPVTVDTSTSPYDAFDTESGALSTAGSFFDVIHAGVPLETSVPKVRVTPLDALGKSGTLMSASISNLTRGADGASCDPRGFTGCLVDSVCVPGLTQTSGKCAKGSTARAAACAAAPKLDPDAGITAFAGRITGGSLWALPDGCTSAANAGHAQAFVGLHLGSTAKTLTISTLRPETRTDTVLSLVAACADEAELDWCHDDDESGFASSLTLSDVAAGEYTIIVELGAHGDGEFGVSVEAK